MGMNRQITFTVKTVLLNTPRGLSHVNRVENLGILMNGNLRLITQINGIVGTSLITKQTDRESFRRTINPVLLPVRWVRSLSLRKRH